jgi:hypothetical protein
MERAETVKVLSDTLSARDPTACPRSSTFHNNTLSFAEFHTGSTVAKCTIRASNKSTNQMLMLAEVCTPRTSCRRFGAKYSLYIHSRREWGIHRVSVRDSGHRGEREKGSCHTRHVEPEDGNSMCFRNYSPHSSITSVFRDVSKEHFASTFRVQQHTKTACCKLVASLTWRNSPDSRQHSSPLPVKRRRVQMPHTRTAEAVTPSATWRHSSTLS